jgi:hypothetical protein
LGNLYQLRAPVLGAHSPLLGAGVGVGGHRAFLPGVPERLARRARCRTRREPRVCPRASGALCLVSRADLSGSRTVDRRIALWPLSCGASHSMLPSELS